MYAPLLSAANFSQEIKALNPSASHCLPGSAAIRSNFCDWAALNFGFIRHPCTGKITMLVPFFQMVSGAGRAPLHSSCYYSRPCSKLLLGLAAAAAIRRLPFLLQRLLLVGIQALATMDISASLSDLALSCCPVQTELRIGYAFS